MNLRSVYNPIKNKHKRYKTITKLVDLKADDKVLNLGCGKGYTFEQFNKKNKIVGMDIFPPKENVIRQENFEYMQRDNDTLPFSKNEFDVVISIGVLEHIQPQSSFEITCQEIQRVGKAYAIIVPHFYTFIEPHYSFPLFQHLPRKTQENLNKKFKLKYVEEKQVQTEFEPIRYLKKKQWQELFPNAKIKTYMHIGPFITNYIIWENPKR